MCVRRRADIEVVDIRVAAQRRHVRINVGVETEFGDEIVRAARRSDGDYVHVHLGVLRRVGPSHETRTRNTNSHTVPRHAIANNHFVRRTTDRRFGIEGRFEPRVVYVGRRIDYRSR